MRTKIVILFLLIVSCGFSQNKTNLVDSLLAVYKTESIPYLQKFASDKYQGKTDELSIIAIDARFKRFLVDIQTIEKRVKEAIESEKIVNDKLLISKIIAKQYEDKFVGLPKEYWDSISKKVDIINVY